MFRLLFDWQLFAALLAVEELSYGSLIIQHAEAIDDIVIANNIAGCAEGLSDKSYGFYWKWEDGGSDFIMEQQKTNTPLLVESSSIDRTDRSNPYSPPRKVCVISLSCLFVHQDLIFLKRHCSLDFYYDLHAGNFGKVENAKWIR